MQARVPEICRDLDELTRTIISCEKCPRLRSYAKFVASHRPKRYLNQEFWARPTPGFGDPEARLLVIGLAPARTGALRTGRIFTGDASSRFLIRALHSAGLANQPISESRDDGLVYTDCYITAAVKCAPPGDRPSPEEVRNCAPYLESEMALLHNLKAVLVLGSLAFRAYVDYLARHGANTRGTAFRHGARYPFDRAPTLYVSYHPSPRNTNTGVLTQAMLVGVLRRISSDLARTRGRPSGSRGPAII